MRTLFILAFAFLAACQAPAPIPDVSPLVGSVSKPGSGGENVHAGGLGLGARLGDAATLRHVR